MTTTLRSLVAPVAAFALALTGVIAFTASPADAATPSFWGTYAPLEWNGNTYDDPPPGESGAGAVYVSGSGDFTFVDTQPGLALTGITGNSNLHVALATYNDGGGDQYVTVFISDQWLQDAPGGPYPTTCAGVNDALFSGDPDCQAFKADILTANGAAVDFSYTDTTGFFDASNNPTTDADVVDIDPQVVWPNYQGSASPLTYGGTDYSADVVGGSGAGSEWLPAGSEPWFASDAAVALPTFPAVGPGGEIAPTHALLLDFGGQTATMYVDGAMFFFLDPMNPFPATCPGFEDFLTAVGASGIDCIAFRADTWAPPTTLGETYTCATDWETGWTDENGDAIDPSSEPTIIDGFEPPALTPIGTDTGPGVCPAAVPPEPPTPPAPPTTTPGGGGSGGGGTDGTGATGGTAGARNAPTLPATGAPTPALAGAALLLLIAGTAVTLVTRRRAQQVAGNSGS